MLPEQFTYLAALIEVVSFMSYIIATLRGKTQPNRVTWFVWALPALISTAAQLSAGVGLSTLIVFIVGAGPLVVFLCSFVNKQAYWKTNPFDYLCGIFAILALIAWRQTHQEVYAIILSVVSDVLAAIPTLRKAWLYPETEDGPTYVIGCVSLLIAILSIQQHSFTAYAFSVCVFLVSITAAVFIYRRRITDVFRRQSV